MELQKELFNIADLPKEAQEDKAKRDKLLQRIVGSPDIYKQQMDGMGGATSSTSKAILVGNQQFKSWCRLLFWTSCNW